MKRKIADPFCTISIQMVKSIQNEEEESIILPILPDSATLYP